MPGSVRARLAGLGRPGGPAQARLGRAGVHIGVDCRPDPRFRISE
ncbi:hypothetical protein [Frankia sp. R43]|nr:hypothetical protein [Frankia sp. R43]